MNNEEKHCVMDDTGKPIEMTEEIEELLQKGMEIVQTTVFQRSLHCSDIPTPEKDTVE